jgi:hypothetical protein
MQNLNERYCFLIQVLFDQLNKEKIKMKILILLSLIAYVIALHRVELKKFSHEQRMIRSIPNKAAKYAMEQKFAPKRKIEGSVNVPIVDYQNAQ